MKIYREEAKQVHYIPPRVYSPRYGYMSSYDVDSPAWSTRRSSSPDLFDSSIGEESTLIDDYMPAMPEDGMDVPVGATAQNNFQPIKWLYCSACYEKVKATETDNHTCEVDSGAE